MERNLREGGGFVESRSDMRGGRRVCRLIDKNVRECRCR